MASCGQTQDANVGSISVPSLQKNNASELLPADYSGTGIPLPFPFLPIQMPAENLYGYQQNFPSGGVHDLNVVTNVDEHNRYPRNIPVDMDVIVKNDDSVPGNQIFDYTGSGVDSMSSGYQTSNNVMNAYQGINRLPQFENLFGGININSVSADNCGVENFNMSVLNAETQNSRRQPAGINRTITNFSCSEPKFGLSVLPSVYDNRVRVNSCQPNSADNLDGRFLSLGYQSNVASNLNSDIYGEKASQMNDTSFSSQGQLGNNSINNVRGSLAGFENNVGGLATSWDCGGNLSLSCDMGGMAFENDMTSINLHKGQVNMHHYMPTPSAIISGSGTETDPIICSSDSSGCSGANPHMNSNISGSNEGSSEYVKKRRHRVSFNSSILRNNHQNATDQLQNSYLSTNLMLPSAGTISGHAGESNSQYESDLAFGNIFSSSSVQAVEGDQIQRSSRLLPTGQGVDIPVKSELPCASKAVNGESRKRNLNLPPRATIQHQRRKISLQTSTPQFSPDLLQNALGQIDTGHSLPAFTSSLMSSHISGERKDFVASGWTRNTTPLPPVAGIFDPYPVKVSQNPTASAADFLPPNDIPASSRASEETSLAISSSTMRSPAFLANTSTIPVVASERPASVSPHVDAPPTVLARTVTSRPDSRRIPIPATPSKRYMAASFSPKAHNPVSATAPPKTHLLHTGSNMSHKALGNWKKSLPAHLAALAKAAPALRASQVPSSMSHIKWQGFNTPPTIGFKCMLCKRDLSFSPEGPFIQPPIPPTVAVLPCGHTFHDHCLLLITPDAESKGPPCIPCAMGEKCSSSKP